MKSKLNFPPVFLAVFALILMLAFASCRKYDDGPTVSFRSKEARVENVWKVESISRNDLDESDLYQSITWNFQDANSEGVGQLEWTYRLEGDSADVVFPATWELATLDEQIKLTYLDIVDPINSVIETRLLYLDIRRLAEDEFWFEYKLDGDSYFVRLVPN